MGKDRWTQRAGRPFSGAAGIAGHAHRRDL